MSKPLSEVSTTELENELRRRGCAVVVITPDDVAEQWRTNQDADESDEPAPTETETRSALAFVQRRLDRTVHENEPAFEWGATSDACEWIAAARQAKKKADAPRPWAIELRDHPGEPVFWNNQDGWGDAGNADRFTDAEKQTLKLPAGGSWVRKEEVSK